MSEQPVVRRASAVSDFERAGVEDSAFQVLPRPARQRLVSASELRKLGLRELLEVQERIVCALDGPG